MSAVRTALVVVSHSHALALAAVRLAAEMGAEVPIEIAAGLDETTLGTDAAAVSAAIEAAAALLPPDASPAGSGVVVLLDLGSAVLSAEMALEFLDPDLAARVRISAAPLVEGLVVAAVSAAGGATPERVAEQAQRALEAKQQALGVRPVEADSDSGSTTSAEEGTASAGVSVEVRILDPAGLHARPAALLAAEAASLPAGITATNLETGYGPVAADSMLELMTLGLTASSPLRLTATGERAEESLRALVAIVEDEVNAPFR